jgi:hypothetical protein
MSAAPDAPTQRIRVGAPVLARAGSSAAAVEVKLVEAGDVVVTAVVVVDDAVELVAAVEGVVRFTAVVLVEVEEEVVAGATVNGAENTLGAVKSF